MAKLLLVGDRVDRDDGRFYIPIYRDEFIVCRVASDAFDNDEEEAVIFADVLVDRWNHIEGRK